MLSTSGFLDARVLACPLGEEDEARPHSLAGDSSRILRGGKSLSDLHSST
jgi:hypothetical protein